MNTEFSRHQRDSSNVTAGFRTQQLDSKLKADDSTSQDSLLRSKERRLDEQFRNLVDQSNRSKEFIDKVYQATFSSTKPPSNFGSPPENPLSSGLVRSPSGNYHPQFENTYTSATSQQRDNLRVPDYDNRKVQEEYNSKLEHEIQDLKNTVLERLRYQEAQGKGKSADPKKNSKPKIETTSSSDEEEPEQDNESEIPKKVNVRSYKGTGLKRPIRSPEYTLKKPRGSKQHEELEYSENVLENRVKSTAKNVAALKNKFDEREAVLRDKYLNLKYKAKEMRSTLQEYVDKCVDLEEHLQKKDRTLLDYEDQVKQSQQELLRNFEILQEAKRNEEIILKSEEDLRIQCGEFKSRIQEYKKRVDDLEEHARKNEIKSTTQLEDLQSERQELRLGLRDRDDKLELVSTANEKLKGEADKLQKEVDKRENLLAKQNDQLEKKDVLYRELKEKFDAVLVENRGLQTKNEEYRENKASLEERIAKYKKKIDEDKVRWDLDKGKEFARKKEKNKLLKSQIKELEGVIQKLNDDKKDLRVEIERVVSHKTHQEGDVTKYREELLLAQQEVKAIKSTFETLKNQYDEINRNFLKEADKATSLQVENKKLGKTVKILEERASLTDREFVKSDDLNMKLRNELKIVLEENEKAKEYISQLETKLTIVGTRQDDELTKFEAKITQLEREIQVMRDENTILKNSQTNLSRELEGTRDERDHYKRDYKSLKQINKNLEKDLRDVDERVREFIHEKQIELRDHNKDMTMQKQVNSKLKALEEIQSMIRSHRQSQRNRLDYTE